jgi:hypothetical protein
MPNAHDPRRHFAGQPAQPPAPDDATFRFGAPAAADTPATLRGPDAPATPRGPDADEPTRATVLDPGSWSSEVPPAPAPVPAGLRRFGPGVPGPDTSAGTAHTSAVWHGTVRPGEPVLPPGGVRHRRRRTRGWLLAVVVLLAVLSYLAWQHFPSSARVDSVAVRNSAAVQGCHSTAKVVGTLRTSGGAGTVHYRWRRSDGTVSDELTQRVGKGRRSTDVVLLWTFDGPGSLSATATLEVLTPQHRSASATFPYHCG